MDSQQIEHLVSNGLFAGKPIRGELIETHISWVVLGEDYVFKIKKPLHYNFLDFSTLGKRKFYCEREVELNLRLTDIYLDVLPVRKHDSFISIGTGTSTGEGEIIDYAVRMKKMDNDKKMDNLLSKREVGEEQIKVLAGKIVDFHKTAEVIKSPFDIGTAMEDFNDLESVADWVDEALGNTYAMTIYRAINLSDQLLNKYASRIQDRIRDGFRRDVHGDLHSKNIFLYDDPVIFDCIEFNDDMRRIDLINEIAFFCMDLEAHGRLDLSRKFLEVYLDAFEIIHNDSDRSLFTYYKMYRANVRAKVNALRAMQTDHTKYMDKCLGECRDYLELMENYRNELH